ncbi:SpoIIE family protein phosphatase [Pseudonocardia sp. N23]|uniref:SpoIIE family protein phosphatase n=1 Tax=Pseudonocardia sp. N23 TaxID=1987376 RepID=UPI000C027ED3|nr:SpoIIE family protein phosphatase [Pseudonocardia sp. N23]GAY12895.1 serine phosphatase RsbU, regulator of sigma subunit [Pseudonocardia sp. N23]
MIEPTGPPGGDRVLDVAALHARADWAATSLGPEHTWPAALNQTLATIAPSPQPMVVCWGPRLVVFYNDAMADNLGDLHPEVYGQPADQVGDGTWRRFGPTVRGVLETGDARERRDDVVMVRRGGTDEESLRDHVYSPIRDLDGRVGGVLVVVRESGRSVRLPAAPEPFPGSRERVLVVESDTAMRDHLLRLLAERWTVQAVAAADQALEAALSEPPDLVVANVALPGTGGIGLLRALRTDARTAGLPVVMLSELAGEEAAVSGLAAGADDYLVTPFSPRELLARVANHLHLGRTRRAAELQFRATADATPALIWVDDVGGHRVFVNRGWLDFTGVSDPVSELADWRERIHPEDRARHRAVTAAATGAGAPFEVEFRLRHRDGGYRWVLDRGAPIAVGDRAAGYVGGCLDIDERHREQRRHRLYAALGDTLDAELTATGRLAALARFVVDEGLVDVARVHEGGTEETLVVSAVAAADPTHEPLIRALVSSPAMRRETLGSGEARLFEPTELFVDDYPDPLWRKVGMHSVVAVSLTARGGMLGLLGAGRCHGSPAFTEDDCEVFTEIGRRAGVAIDNARLLELERASAQRLGLLHRATAEMSAAATPAEVAGIAARHMETLLAAPVVGVWELRDGRLEALTRSGWGLSAQRAWSSVALSSSEAAVSVVESGSPIWLSSPAEVQARWPQLVDDRPDGLGAVGLLPLAVGQRSVGVMAVAFRDPRPFSSSDREAATAVAELAAQALDRSSLLVAETEGRRVAERLAGVATALARATDLQSVADVIVDHGLSALQAEAVVVCLTDETGALHSVSEQGWPGPKDDVLLSTAAHPLAATVRSGEPIWSVDPGDGPWPAHTAIPLLVGGRTIGVLGFRFATRPRFTPERRSFVLTLGGQCAQAVMRARLHQAEHEVAVTLQRSLLPQSLPETERLAMATRYQPGTEGTEAGGDWFDVLDLGEQRFALVVGDVVGRGPSAAAVMGQLRSALAANLVNGQSPAGALEQLDLFARRVKGAMASTVVCAVIDCSTGDLRYACAGHPPPLVAGIDGVRLLAAGRGTPLGVFGRPPFVEAEDRLDLGETILLCSDGLFERRNEVIDDGMDRLVDVFGDLTGTRPEPSADALLERMSEGSAVPDDTALVLARLLPAPLRLELAAEPKELAGLRRVVARWCTHAGVDEDAVTDLQLALGEAATNAVEHAYPSGADGVVEVDLDLLPDATVAVRVTDHGTWRPPPADPGYRGRGLVLIRELAREVEVVAGDDGTVVSFHMPPVPVAVPTASATRRAWSPRVLEVSAVPSAPVGAGPSAIVVTGDLDLAGVQEVRAGLLDSATAGTPLVLTLPTDCYVSSAGVALLTELAEQAGAAGSVLTVVTPAGSAARRILQLAALDAVIAVADG